VRVEALADAAADDEVWLDSVSVAAAVVVVVVVVATASLETVSSAVTAFDAAALTTVSASLVDAYMAPTSATPATADAVPTTIRDRLATCGRFLRIRELGLVVIEESPCFLPWFEPNLGGVWEITDKADGVPLPPYSDEGGVSRACGPCRHGGWCPGPPPWR
jgi:hypothetical protein